MGLLREWVNQSVLFLIGSGNLLVSTIVFCLKKSPKNEIIALSSSTHPPEQIMKELNKFNITSIVKMASSYKFCVIANGEFDIYAAKERANEWDYAAGHAVAEHAGAIIKTLDNKPFHYGKEDYANPSILMKRAQKVYY